LYDRRSNDLLWILQPKVITAGIVAIHRLPREPKCAVHVAPRHRSSGRRYRALDWSHRWFLLPRVALGQFLAQGIAQGFEEGPARKP